MAEEKPICWALLVSFLQARELLRLASMQVSQVMAVLQEELRAMLLLPGSTSVRSGLARQR